MLPNRHAILQAANCNLKALFYPENLDEAMGESWEAQAILACGQNSFPP